MGPQTGLALGLQDFYDRIIAACVPGMTVEIGGGIGNLKQRLPNVVATDIQFSPWLDLVADAQKLPLAPDVVSNIVMVDVLHHVEFPVIFFREAEQVLRAGGRIVMVKPAITFGSTLFYRLLHHEPVITSADPLVVGAPNSRARSWRFQPSDPDIDRTADCPFAPRRDELEEGRDKLG